MIASSQMESRMAEEYAIRMVSIEGCFTEMKKVKWTNQDLSISGQGEMVWSQDEQVTNTYTGEFCETPMPIFDTCNHN